MDTRGTGTGAFIGGTILPLLLAGCGAIDSSDPPLETTTSTLNGTPVTDTFGVPSVSMGCSAVALSPYWVLTARHCGVSTHLREDAVTVQSGTTAVVTRALQHPSADAALMRLATPLPGPNKNGLYQGTRESLVGKTATCFGWGPNQAGGASGTLRVGTVTISGLIDNPGPWGFLVTPNLVFPGDSGGPCFVNLPDGTPVVAGIATSGNSYTAAPFFKDWASQVMTGDLMPTEIIFTEHDAWRGQASALGPGNYASPSAMFMPDNAVTSYRIGSMVDVMLRDQLNFGGQGFQGFAGLDQVNLLNVGFNDMTSSAQVTATTTCREPLANEVALFQHADFQGACALLRPVSIDDMNALPVMSDQVSSVKVGSNVQLTLYDGVGFTGSFVRIMSNVPNLQSSSFNDMASALRINGRACGPPLSSSVVIWTDAEYQGSCIRMSMASFSTMPSGFNDNVSSVQVGTNARLDLYTDPAFGGGQVHLQTDHPFLPALADHAFTSPIQLNDAASSARVTPQTNCGLPGSRQVIVYADINFTGRCRILEIGNYSNAVNTDFDLGNDRMTGIRVGSQVAATLFEDDRFISPNGILRLTQDVGDLTTRPRGTGGLNWNDTVSAIKVTLR